MNQTDFAKPSLAILTQQFWDWSVQVYGFTEVRQTCLEMQNFFGLNVNYLLLCIWLEQKSIQVTESDWQQVKKEAQAVNAQVAEIRSKRLKYKEINQKTYQKLLTLELKGERLIQKTALKSLVNNCKLLKMWADALEKTETNRNLLVYIATCVANESVFEQAKSCAQKLQRQISSVIN